MDEFMVRAALAGIAVAAVGGALGCFLVWRRMAFFGDTLAHAALLGIALGLLLEVSAPAAALGLCLGIALLFTQLEGRGGLGTDTLLAVIAHGTLAAGVIAIALIGTRGAGLEAYLFGDLLAVGDAELALIGAVGAAVAALTAWRWQDWLAIAVDEDLARIEGIAVERAKRLQVLAIAALIAVAMNVVGVLLVTALLVIPPATGRALARSPEQMAVLGASCGALSVLGGLAASWNLDTPAGPSVVVSACLLFALARLVCGRSRG